MSNVSAYFGVEIEALTIARRTSIVLANALAFALLMLLASESAAAVTRKPQAVLLASSDSIKTRADAVEGRRVFHSLAALQPGDVILSYNHEPVIDAGDLSAKVGMAAPGNSAIVEVWRDGKTITLEARLSPSEQQLASTEIAGSKSSYGIPGRLGLEVRPLTSDEREQAGVSAGLLVQAVSGHAAEAGIESGDIVLAVDRTPVSSTPQLRSVVGQHEKEVALLVQRGNQRPFIPVQLG
jgi:membrane-associated protease RseP (regulator of RpoE activity)